MSIYRSKIDIYREDSKQLDITLTNTIYTVVICLGSA